MYFKHNIHQLLYSLRFPVTLKISYEQSLWVRGENTSLLERPFKIPWSPLERLLIFTWNTLKTSLKHLVTSSKQTFNNRVTSNKCSIFLKHLWKILETLLKVPWNCLENFLHFLETFLKDPWNTLETPFKCSKKTPETSLNHASNFLETP